jgi:DNA-binding response OmpR family regulator
MLAVTRDAAWAARLERLAAAASRPFRAQPDLAVARGARAPGLVVLDAALCGARASDGVARARALFPDAAVALACADGDLAPGAVDAVLAAGADETLSKSWSDARLGARLAALSDAALAASARVSPDGTLRADRRSQRAYVRRGARWTELGLPAAEFALLWTLLGAGGEPVSREQLIAVLREALGREVEAETVARRALSLRKALGAWGGALESVRGGRYRLVSSRRRSTT